MRSRWLTAGMMTLCSLSGAARAEPCTPEQTYDAIVVGSGYGGSVAAFELAQAGVSTLVIERGRRWKIDDPRADQPFPTQDTVLAPAGDPRGGWLTDQCHGDIYSNFLPPRS